MKKLRLWAFTLLLVSTLLPPMRVSIAQLDMGDGATSGDLFDRIPPPITDFFIPAQQVSAGPPTERSASDFIGRIYAPKPEDWKVRSDARPITGVTVTIKSGSRAGESVITNNSGYYRFPNVRGDELHLRVEKEYFEPKEVIVHRSHPTILANGDVLNYPEDVQQNPGSILMGQSWPDEVRFILEETRVVHDLLYAEGGAPPVGEKIGAFYSRGVIVMYSHQFAQRQNSVGVLITFAHEIAHARQHALVSVDGSAWGIHDWNNTPEGIAYKEAREKDWNEVGKAQLDYGRDRPDYRGNVLTETAAETIAHYWSVDRWGGRPHYGDLRITAPNRFKWAAVWLQKQSERLQPLSKILGDNQTGLSNTPLPLPFAVVVRNLDDGFPLSGVSIMFAVTAGGGTLSAPRATTDHTGIAETTLTLGPNIGTNTVSVSAVGIEGTVTFNAVAEGPVDIPDASLRAAIKTDLGKAPGAPIAPVEMTKLTRLEARNANISDLSGLEFATNLIELRLHDNHITDISALLNLTNLEGLWLDNNAISDISAVANLTNLRKLHLWRNSVSDISPLAGLTNLTGLYLGGSSASDLSPLARLTNLESLFLDDNGILDLSPLAGLTKLTRLALNGNSISDLSPLAGLTNLKWMRLASNNISDLSPLVANTGLGSGDELDIRGNPLSYLSIYTYIPKLQDRGVRVKFDNRTPATPLKISGDDQQAAPGASLARLLVVEVRDQHGRAFAGVPVTFSVTAGGGKLSTTTTTTDANGRAESTLTLGSGAGPNTVNVSVEGVSETVTFTSIAGIEFDLPVPAGISLIHIPLKVTTVDGVAGAIESIGELYDALGGADTVNFLITYDSQAQGWLSYFVPADKGTPADATLTDDIGIIAGMKAPVSIRLSGAALGTNGSSAISLNQGLNLVGLPLRDPRITRVSDLFTLDGIRGNVPAIILADGGDFKSVRRVGDPGDIPVTGGQSFILTAQRTATIVISGDGWYNVSGGAAAPPVGNADLHSLLTGIKVTDTTPVLALRGSIIHETVDLNKGAFRVIVKNLSNGKIITGMTRDNEETNYQLTIVDVETERAAQIGDILEISVRSTSPLIGVQPLRHTVTAEDVKRSLIQLPTLVAYEIPTETELLPNYPNPFNPETWIPYRLAEDAFVALTIYDTAGQVIHTLNLGHRIASAYESRSKAIYWDGKNRLGERVASGIYFYTLKAGDFSATRRMVILK